MPDDRESMYHTPANKALDTAEQLLTDMSEDKLVDSRDKDQRQFDAMFYLLKGVLLELERIGDQLEYSAKGYLDRDKV